MLAALEMLPDAIFCLRRDGTILDFRAPDTSILYAPPEIFLNKRVRDVLPPDVAHGIEEHIVKTLDSAASQVFEYQLTISDAPRDFEARFQKSNRDEVVVFVRDVTEKKRAETALAESQAHYADLFEHSLVLIQSVGADGRFRWVNPAWLDVMGYGADEITNLSLMDIIHPDNREHCAKLFQRIMAGEDVGAFEAEFVAKNGRRVFVEGNANCRKENGEILSTRAIFRDVTDRKTMALALQQSEERFRQVLRQAPDAIYTLDEEGRFTDANQQACEQTGYSREELLNLRQWDISVGSSPEKFAALLAEHEASGAKTIETRHRRKDGSTFPVEIQASVIEASGQRMALALVRDVTQRHAQQREIQTMKERVDMVVNSAPIVLFALDRDGVCTL